MNKKIILVFICLLVTKVNALQIRAAKDNQSIAAVISSSELTRIFVTDDRVIAARGINGAYELIKDEKEGCIFLKPTPYFIAKPFNLFITTEAGHTYNFRLNSKKMPAEVIEIKPLSPTVQAEIWEKNSPYVETLVQLIKSMVANEHPEGFAVIPVKGEIIRFPSISMQLQLIYRGNHLQGEVWRIKNCTNRAISLHPNQFYQKQSRAIALQLEWVASGAEVYLYKVNQYE